MAKIFEFKPSRSNENDKNKSGVEKGKKINLTNIQGQEKKSQNTSYRESVEELDNRYGTNMSGIAAMMEQKLFPFGKNVHNEFVEKKNKVNGLKGNISRSSYNQYYNNFINSPIGEIIDIAHNISDEDINVRPAYVSALLDCFFVKEAELKEI